MSTVHDTFQELLKRGGYSITAARRAVFDALLGQEPLAMQQLVAKTKAVDRASVYRAIELFERLGIVQRLNTGWKYRIELTDKFSAHHHHITCTACGATVAINEGQLERLIESLAHDHGFTLSSHQIEIQGICDACHQVHVRSS
jgi:Fur family ferric uptake transcriptional regulator